MLQPLAQLVIAVASDRHQSSAVRIQSSGSLMYSVSYIDKTKNKIKIRRVIITFCRWLDLKCGLLVSEATALPTEPNLLHSQIFAYLGNNITLNQLLVSICIRVNEPILNTSLQFCTMGYR